MLNANPDSSVQPGEDNPCAVMLRKRVLEVARWQKVNLFHMGVLLHIIVGLTLAPDSAWGFGLVKFFWLEYAGMAVLSCVCLIRASCHMKRCLAWTLIALLQFVYPFVTPLILLAAHLEMSHYLREHGATVSWLGADLATLKCRAA